MKEKIRVGKPGKDVLFLCDSCGKESVGVKYPVFDENFNKQIGVNQYVRCYKNSIVK